MIMTDKRSVADRMVFGEVTHDNWRDFEGLFECRVVLRLVGAWSGVPRLFSATDRRIDPQSCDEGAYHGGYDCGTVKSFEQGARGAVFCGAALNLPSTRRTWRG